MKTRWILGMLLVLTLGCAKSPLNEPEKLVEGLGGASPNDFFLVLDQANNAPAIRDALLKGLTHRNPKVRAKCVHLLGRKKDVTVVEALKPLLLDVDFQVRIQTAVI